MNKKNTEKLFKKFDYMFRERNLPMNQTCMCWGIETGDGWYKLLHDLCTALKKELDKPGNEQLKNEFSVKQVKEKFSTLRFYTNGYSNKNIRDLIMAAEEKSAKTCEVCGKPGTRVNIRGWLSTLCAADKKKREANK